MELPNIHFQDFPIEFKEINPEDFPHFNVEEKIIISPNIDGFINDELKSKINFSEKNTVIVNAAVGQGKTFSIIEIIKEYYEADENYLIVVAVPYVSLVQQYLNDIVNKDIPESQIYRYEYIGTQTHIDAWNSKIQIITVNGLLGNPGEDAFINEMHKRNYLNYMSNKCIEDNRKVVFIYDEIHDTIHNFKEKYIFNLWKWKNVIHKNIILSATYNEASKVVIEYLAELTDSKIQIIESERKRFLTKQSDLYLHFNTAKVYTNDNDSICKLVEDLILKDKKIDILSFSRILANDICKKTHEGIGKLLIDKFGDIQNCVSDMDSNQRTYRETPQNRYDKTKCNVGTNFKTGISINKENHAFIIILPPSGRKKIFKNNFGIFTDGINSIIQALARQRTKGEIYMILPPPEKFNFASLPFDDEKKEIFKKSYQIRESNRESHSIVDYKPLNEQNAYLEEFYNDTLKDNIKNEIRAKEDSNRINKVRLEFPEFKHFKMNEGERYLTNKFLFFGGDLSAFIVYSAFTNQFINCNLTGINSKQIVYFKEGILQWLLEKFFNNYFNLDSYLYLRQSTSDKYVYHEIVNEIFLNYKVSFKSTSEGTKKIVEKNECKLLEQQILAFIQRKLYPNNRIFEEKYQNDGYLNDSQFSRGEYFSMCIAHALRQNEESEDINQPTKDLIIAYKSLNYFKDKLTSSIQQTSIGSNEVNFILNTPNDGFILPGEQQRFNNMISTLIEKDYFIKNEIFDFKNNFERTENQIFENKAKAFYNYLKSDFLITKPRRINNSQMNFNVSEVITVLELPNPDLVLNLINDAEITIPEEHMTTLSIVDGRIVLS